MVKYYSINGALVPAAEASLGVTDLSILRGYGIFDFFRVSNGIPVFIEDHLQRFATSAKYMDLELPFSLVELHDKVIEVIRHNQLPESGIRLLLTGGYSPDGYNPGKPNLLILEHPFKEYDPEVFEKGIKLMTFQYVRETPRTKTTNYLISIQLQKQISNCGAMDVLYQQGGKFSESSRSNFFIVTPDGTIATPEDSILEGITRKKAINIAKKYYKIEIRDVKVEEIETAREAFITSTTKGIMPVTWIDDQRIGDGKPGTISLDLRKRLEELKQQYIESKREALAK